MEKWFTQARTIICHGKMLYTSTWVVDSVYVSITNPSGKQALGTCTFIMPFKGQTSNGYLAAVCRLRRN